MKLLTNSQYEKYKQLQDNANELKSDKPIQIFSVSTKNFPSAILIHADDYIIYPASNTAEFTKEDIIVAYFTDITSIVMIYAADYSSKAKFDDFSKAMLHNPKI